MRVPTAASPYRQVFFILIIGWLVRILFVWFMPAEAKSTDIYSWEKVADILAAGQNPYKETLALNWPPFWMQLVFLMAKVASLLHVPLVHVLQVFLAGVESVMVVVLHRFIRQIEPKVRPFSLLLLGIALNPMAIFLVCQHGNFDVLVGLWVLLFVGQLVEYQRSQNGVDWLLACLFLGLGILTKTVPLVLCPMLAGGWRRTAWPARLLGTAFVLGPVILGMSIIYVLTPDDVAVKVLAYRSASGWFGISGLLHLAGADDWTGITDKLFYLLLLIAAGFTARLFWQRERVEAREVVLIAALFLAGIPGIGPGYGPQYLYWYLPLLITTYACYAGFWRWVLIAFWLVGSATYIVEYALFRSHGQFLVYLLGHDGKLDVTVKQYEWLMWAICQEGQIQVRVPLFVASLVLLSAGTALCLRPPRPAGAVQPLRAARRRPRA